MKKPSPARKIFGFTLLELLVVISIIGILVAIGAASFSVAQRQGRDARRRGDLKAFQNCMEQESTKLTGNHIYTHAMGDSTCITGLRDPATNVAYTQEVETNASGHGVGYCAAALLDNSTKGNCGGCNANGTVITGASTHFCVTALQ